MQLIALDQNSIELMKLSKKLCKAKTEKDKKLIIRQIQYFKGKIEAEKKESEIYFQKM